MDESPYLPYLRSLLYKVMHRPHLDVTSITFAQKLKEVYTAEEYARFIESLEWASSNPTYDFTSLLPGPTSDLSNEAVYDSFLRILTALKAT